jgi:hypothetical protein
MQFQKGNRFSQGRPKGSRNKGSAELAAVAGELLAAHFRTTAERLLRSRNQMVVLQTLRFLADRAFGKPPVSVEAQVNREGGIDPCSPIGIFLALSNQGPSGESTRDEGEGNSPSQRGGAPT